MIVLRVRNMTAIDATGLHALEFFSDRLRKTGSNRPGCWSMNMTFEGLGKEIGADFERAAL